MKTLLKSCAIFLLLMPFSLSSFAVDQKPYKGRGMMGAMSDEQIDEKIRKKQEHMLKMHDLYDRILAETDEAKKEKLMQEQRDLMKVKMKAKRERMREHHQKMMEKKKK